LSATGATGDESVWAEIDGFNTPSWAEVSTTQTPGWAEITT
jgi:hypothetical protein